MSAPQKVAVSAGLLLMLAATACNADKQLAVAQETGAIQRIKTVQQAETQYYAQYGKYAASLSQIQDMVPPDLLSGKSNGYLFALIARPNGFAVTAAPETSSPSPRRWFYSDETLVIRASTTQEPATAASPEIK